MAGRPRAGRAGTAGAQHPPPPACWVPCSVPFTTTAQANQHCCACSHLNMSWREQMLAALSGGMLGMVRARNTGRKSAKLRRTVCQPGGRRREKQGRCGVG